MRSRAALVVVAALLLPGCLQVLQGGPPGPRGPGQAYESYLGPGADTVVVEIDHVPGALWDESTPAEEDFVDQIERITGKEVRIETNASLPPQGSDYRYSVAELYELRDEYRSIEEGNGTVVMHALFLDGEFQGRTVGLAFAADTFAIFKGTIEDSGNTCENDADVCGDPANALLVDQDSVPEWAFTRAVAIHEAGHLAGLVNCPLPMVQDHEMDEDPNPNTTQNEGRCHSSNQDSVMTWQLEAEGEAGDVVEGGEVPWTFDENDLRDARQVRNG